MEIARATKEEKRKSQIIQFEKISMKSIRAKAEKALKRLKETAINRGDNIFAELMETVKVASLGQVARALVRSGPPIPEKYVIFARMNFLKIYSPPRIIKPGLKGAGNKLFFRRKVFLILFYFLLIKAGKMAYSCYKPFSYVFILGAKKAYPAVARGNGNFPCDCR